MKTPLFGDYSFEEATDPNAFGEFLKLNHPVVFNKQSTARIGMILTEPEKEKHRELAKNMEGAFVLRIYFFKGDEKIGWFIGDQVGPDNFKMRNTGIFAEHQNKGIYTAFLPILLSLLKEKGFLKINSNHICTNNQVIIPKLKIGFVITGLELTESFGLLVQLTFCFHEKMKKVLDLRAGMNMDDPEAREILGF